MPLTITTIRAGRRARHYWQDLWKYRDLLYFLAWRDILVRYKQTTIGIAWALLRPFISMVVFTLIFAGIAQLPSEGAPYPILVFSAMLPWQFFSSALTDCSNSLIVDSNLISKVYFPRLLVPIGSVVVNFVDLMISGVILLGLMAYYSFIPDWHILTIPLFTALAVAVTIGGGLWFAALNVEYRDFRYIVPFIVQLGFFVSPVGFSSDRIPEQWRLLYSLNPLVGIIDGFRWAIIGDSYSLYWPGVMLAVVVIGFLLWSGITHFRMTEKKFADII